MYRLHDLCSFLESFAPLALAESWDNVGLLAGDPELPIERVMTCLTVTPQSAAEAVERRADVVVTHHPLPFQALKRVVSTSPPGQLLWQLLTHRIAIYSPHTAFDSTAEGINQQLATGLDLLDIQPLVPIPGAPEGTGGGRVGRLAQALSLAQLATRLKTFLGIDRLQYVGRPETLIQRVAVACGAAGSFLEAAAHAGCGLLVLGETNLHTCLAAESRQVALLLPGHYASERFAVERLAELLQRQFPGLEVWSSQRETDPLHDG